MCQQPYLCAHLILVAVPVSQRAYTEIIRIRSHSRIAFAHIQWSAKCDESSTYIFSGVSEPRASKSPVFTFNFAKFHFQFRHRTLFYTDTGDSDRDVAPRIYSAAMDGSSPDVIVTRTLIRPMYIAVDNPGVNGRIYWTDGGHNMVYGASLHGAEPSAITGEGMHTSEILLK